METKKSSQLRAVQLAALWFYAGIKHKTLKKENRMKFVCIFSRKSGGEKSEGILRESIPKRGWQATFPLLRYITQSSRKEKGLTSRTTSMTVPSRASMMPTMRSPNWTFSGSPTME